MRWAMVVAASWNRQLVVGDEVPGLAEQFEAEQAEQLRPCEHDSDATSRRWRREFDRRAKPVNEAAVAGADDHRGRAWLDEPAVDVARRPRSG